MRKSHPTAFPAPPPSSAWPSGGLPRHPSSWCSPGAHCASCRPRARRPFQSGVGLGALPALIDQLPLPHGQILEPGLEFEGPRPPPGPTPLLLAAAAPSCEPRDSALRPSGGIYAHASPLEVLVELVCFFDCHDLQDLDQLLLLADLIKYCE
jgi:hypothetical protein